MPGNSGTESPATASNGGISGEVMREQCATGSRRM